MNRALRLLAVLGVVLVAFATRLFVPDTPTGLTIVFVAFWIAMYPVAGTLGFAPTPRWRYWAGGVLGGAVGWSLDTWRRSIPQASSEMIGAVVFGSVTVAVLARLLWRRRATVEQTDPVLRRTMPIRKSPLGFLG